MEAVCGDNIRESMADGEVQQVKALQEIRAKGIAISTFPPAVLSALKDAWEKVVREESAANPEFRKAWESFSSFRESYRSEEHTSELQSLMRISYAVFCLKKKKQNTYQHSLIALHSTDNIQSLHS